MTKVQKKKAALSNTTTRADIEMDITTIDVAYTIGGATLGFSNSDISNDSYSSNTDTTETILAITLAF
mgnify:FL=1